MRNLVSTLCVACLASGNSLAQVLPPGKPAGIKPAINSTEGQWIFGGMAAIGFGLVGYALSGFGNTSAKAPTVSLTYTTTTTRLITP